MNGNDIFSDEQLGAELILTAREVWTCSRCLVILETTFAMFCLVTYIKSAKEIPCRRIDTLKYFFLKKNIVLTEAG
jgi:hypothetical protein